MRLIIIGSMASGKSTVGKKLSKKLGLDFFDIDDEIENKIMSYKLSLNISDNAVINTNSNAFLNRRNQKQMLQEKEDELDRMRADIEELKKI